ncbi:unnamed protein product [Rotaria sp. Silwood1]|nr:unnamed protein product [Rotaria sp. Silwood1]
MESTIFGSVSNCIEDKENTKHNLSDEDKEEQQRTIIDQIETNLLMFHRTIYLTIRSSISAQECVHKLLKLNLCSGQDV